VPNLILSRKKDQSIAVDGPCRITILSWTPSAVRLAIAGPRSTRIVRTELFNKGSLDGRELHLELADLARSA
jgi:carbon storage regulator CsrA